MDTSLGLYGVTQTYGGAEPAVRDVTVEVGTGETVTLVGPSGCGKSTLLRIAAGLQQPDAGRVDIAGRTVAGPGRWVPPERRRVGLVFQDHGLFPHLTVARNIGFGLDAWSRRDRRARVGEVLDLVGLARLADRYPHELSGGEQQRVALSRALAPRPAVVLLDEPFSSLDENLRVRVRADAFAVLRDSGSTTVLVTHDRTEALSLADRVVLLRDGSVVQAGAPAEPYESPADRFSATFLGDADFLPVDAQGRTLSSEIGALEVPGGHPPPDPRSRLEVMVRPHDIELDADPSASAHIVAAQYHGPMVVHWVRLPSGAVLRSWQPGSGYPAGTAVSVGVRTGASSVLMADGGALMRGVAVVPWP